jgi:hypothetical protein
METEIENYEVEIDESEIIVPSSSGARVNRFRGSASSSFEDNIEKLIGEMEERGVNEEETRQAFFALKAEFRNYKLLQNLYLSLPVLHRNRDRAGLPSAYSDEARDPEFDTQVLNQLELSRELLVSFYERLRPARNRTIRPGALKPQIQ